MLLVPRNRDPDAEVIGALYRNARASIVESVRYSIECGQRLIAKKDSLRHGEWLPWLAANADVLGFETDRTAQRLMKLAGTAEANPTLTSDLDKLDTGTAVAMAKSGVTTALCAARQAQAKTNGTRRRNIWSARVMPLPRDRQRQPCA